MERAPITNQPALTYTMEVYNDQRPPRTWLVESILVTVFCCLPFGIAGIVNAARVESRFNAGDIQGARRASSEARKWTIVSFAIGISGVLFYFVLAVLGIAGGILGG